jgi:signal transduction histidine kinase
VRRLRLQLLIQHLATTAVILALAEVTLFWLVRKSSHARLEATLRKEVEKIAALIELEPERAEIYGDRVDELHLDRTVFSWQVLLPDGSTLAESRDLPAGAALPAVGREPGEGQLRMQFGTWPVTGRALAGRLFTTKERMKKRGRPPKVPDRLVFEVRAAMSAAPADEASRWLGAYLLAGFPVLLGLTGLAATGLIRRAVHPVEVAFERERRFAGAASHELRTPLTALKGEIDLGLRRARGAEEYKATLEAIRPPVEHMTRVVDSLLTLARAEAGSLLLGSMDLSVGDLTEGIREVIGLLEGHERVAISCSADADVRIAGDRTLLVQAVRNLVENALMHGSGTPVEVTVSRHDANVEVRVEDRGGGFSQAVLSAASSTPDKHRPIAQAGLSRFGLALARAIAVAHRGELVLTNPPRGGASARIRVPAAA